MHDDLPLLLTVVWSVAFGLLAQVLAQRWRIPAIVLLLICGVAVGPSGLDLVQPATMGSGLPILVKLAVAIILFEGALNLRLKGLSRSAREIRSLVTVGALVTWILTTVVAYLVVGFPISLAVLFGALMTVTGPTVVQPLMRRMKIPRAIKTVLEGEAILIDPIGAILAVAVLDIILAIGASEPVMAIVAVWGYASRLVIGFVVGGAMAIAISLLMRIPRLVNAELGNLLALAGVWTSFGIAEMIQGEAGIMASVAMGLVMQSEAVPGVRQLRRFKETLTTLSISVLFVLLAANLRIDTVIAEGVTGLVGVLLVMVLVRPIAVFFSTRKSRLTWREKLLISWIGPRGIIAASVASLFALTLTGAGHGDGERLLALTFLAIIMTVTIQGLTAPILARILGLHSMTGRKAVVIGAGRFGRRIAEILREHGRPVVMIDTNQDHVDSARAMGFDAAQGSALDEGVLEQIDIEDAETVIAVTPNSEVNVLAAQVAYEDFRIRRTFPALSSSNREVGARLLEETGGRLAFAEPIDLAAWEECAESAERFEWTVPRPWPARITGSIDFPQTILPVVRVRSESAEVVHAEQVWQTGDRIVFLLRTTPEVAQDMLDALQDPGISVEVRRD